MGKKMVKKIILFGTGALFCLMFIAYSCNNNQNPTTKSTGTTGTTLISTPNPTSSAFVTDPSLPPPDMDTDLLAWDGTTTEEPTLVGDIYEVNNANELAWIAAQTNDFAGKTIKLMDNINMDDQPFDGIASLAGTFEGNKKIVHNININKPSVDNVGLINVLQTGGVIQNLTISEGNILARLGAGGIVGINYGDNTMISNVANYNVTVTGGSGYAGGIVGYNANNITIVNAVNSGEIKGTSFLGGIIGLSYNNSSTPLNVNITKVRNSGNVSGTSSFIGGIVGASSSVTIKDGGNSGDISGVGTVGGIIGVTFQHATTIDDSYNYTIATINGNNEENGGIVGGLYNNNSASELNINNSYYLTASYGAVGKNINAAPLTDNSTEITLAEFATESTFTNWDFVNTWSMGTLHPILK